MSAAGSWQPASELRQPTDVSLLRRVGVHARRIAVDGKHIPRYCLKYGVAVLAIFGLLQVWQACGDGPIPAFRDLHPTMQLEPLRTSHAECLFADADEAARWGALAPALAILAEVNPDVADWVRQTHHDGKLVFANRVKIGDSPAGQLAKHDAFRRELTIGRGLFAENDGTMAAVLCHEYRHSRQRFPKTMVYALSFLLRSGGDSAIIENDAVLYEQEADLAIFGKHQER